MISSLCVQLYVVENSANGMRVLRFIAVWKPGVAHHRFTVVGFGLDHTFDQTGIKIGTKKAEVRRRLQKLKPVQVSGNTLQ